MKNRIRHLRTMRGIRQNALAVEAGVTPSYLSQLENGRHGKKPSFQTLNALAGALGVHIGDLFDDNAAVPVIGKVFDGGRVELEANLKPLYKIMCPYPRALMGQEQQIVAVEVDADGVSPTYSKGDILLFTWDNRSPPESALDTVAICQRCSGTIWLRSVRQGTSPDLFNLISLDLQSQNLFDKCLRWASSVILHLPRALIQLEPEPETDGHNGDGGCVAKTGTYA